MREVIFGIDVSKWQGDIDFKKVKDAGVKFAIIKAFSGYVYGVDPKFYQNVEGFRKVGIPIVGVYNFCYATNDQEALAEAINCVQTVKSAGLPKETIIFFDFEYDTIDKAAERGVKLGANECNRFASIFCDYVHNQGYNTGIYYNLDYYYHMYNKDLLNKYYNWLAHYNQTPHHECHLHQYSSSGYVPGINGNVDLDYLYPNAFSEDILADGVINNTIPAPSFDKPKENTFSRQAMVNLAREFIGFNEADGSYKKIIDIYNSQFPNIPYSGVKMQYDWEWCAAFWSALVIRLGYQDFIPIEISVGRLVDSAKRMGIWEERDDYIPKPGDAIIYDWNDTGYGDNTGWPDHIGIVEYVKDGYITVIEGNLNSKVDRRRLQVNSRYIRGFVTPNYDNEVVDAPELKSDKSIDEIAMEVITGLWSSGEERKILLESHGYSYVEVQQRVNEILSQSKQDEEEPLLDNPNKNINAPYTVVSTIYPELFDRKYQGIYYVNKHEGTLCRNGAGSNKQILLNLGAGAGIMCFGLYSLDQNKQPWLHANFVYDKTVYICYVRLSDLTK